ncbi:MAG: FG-GAP-like repeat-containing protein [Planctomycetota bacterium]
MVSLSDLCPARLVALSMGLLRALSAQTHLVELPRRHLPDGVARLEKRILVDVDRDGDKDLIVSGKPTRLYLNDGKARFRDVTATHPPPTELNYQDVVAGDIDGDGDLDLVIAVYYAPSVILLNDGKGRFALAPSGRLPPVGDNKSTMSVSLGDLDLDGDLDLVWGSWGTKVFLNVGKGQFRDVTNTRIRFVKAFTHPTLLTDLDGDGDADLFAGGWIFLNLHRQVHAPLVPRPGHPYELEIYARAGHARSFQLAIPFTASGLKKTSIPRYGTFGLDPTRMVVGDLVVLLPPRGTVTLRYRVPASKSLLGLPLANQALIIGDLVEKDWGFTNVTALALWN